MSQHWQNFKLYEESTKLCAPKNVLMCQLALLFYVLACQRTLHAYMLTCHDALRANWQRTLLAHVQKVSTCLFFEVKLIFCPVLYWDEKSLLIKVEARKVTRNASGNNGSFKMLISQIHLGFVISFINNRRFIDVDPVKHINSFL